MSCGCSHPIPGNRHPDTCARCARLIPANPLPPEDVAEFFDYVEGMLEGAGEKVPGEPDVTWAYLKAHAISRLIKGAKEYGNANFLRPEVNLPREGAEEQADNLNYALMERLKHKSIDGFADLTGVAFHTYMVQKCWLRYQSRRRGGQW